MAKQMSCKRMGCALIGALLVVLMLVLCNLVSPACAMAGDDVAYSLDKNGKKTEYKSIESALEAGYEGATIVMTKTWDLESTLTIADSKSITIDMNSHAIKGNGSFGCIRLCEHASLNLYGSTGRMFTFSGYNADTAGELSEKVYDTADGMITGGSDSSYAGGIRMDAYSRLTLDDIDVVGNYGKAGGIYAKGNCQINLKNESTVGYNKGDHGGIYVGGSDTTLELDGQSSLQYNYGTSWGGGLYSSADATRIIMNGSSYVCHNYGKAGGGLYFNYSYFNVMSEDGTASIYGNTTTSDSSDDGGGGGIYVCSRHWGSNEGEIRGVTIKENVSASHGGGIYLGQEYTTVANCTINNNTAGRHGGGICVMNDDNTIDGCTVNDNYCGTLHNYMGNLLYGGGGIFVSSECDVKVAGKLCVKDNYSKSLHYSDDLHLEDGNYTHAYITGSLKRGSRVGVRTDTDDDRKIAKSFTHETDNCFFSCLYFRHIDYQDSLTADVWQRDGGSAYRLTVNGKNMGTRNLSDGINIDGQTSDPEKAFWRWSEDESSGLNPLSEVIKVYSPTIGFAMPANNVELNAEYIDRVKNVTITVQRPEVGQKFNWKGTLSWTQDGEELSKEVSICWYDEDGKYAYTAQVGGKYHFAANISEDIKNKLAFYGGIDKSNVTIKCTDGEAAVGTKDANVGSDSKLNMTSDNFSMTKPSISQIESTKMSVTAGSTESEVLEALPCSARAAISDGTSVTLNTNKSAEISWPEGLFSDGVVANPEGEDSSYEVSVPLEAYDGATGAGGKKLQVYISVLSSTEVATPVLSLVGGSYDKCYGAVKLSDDDTLKLTAASTTSNATIMYKVDGGEATTYNANDGIILTGEDCKNVEHKVEVWAVSGEVESKHTTYTYKLNDTLKKTISVECGDTAYYSEGETHWSDSLEATADLGVTATITAPYEEGRSFDHWEWEGAPEGTDLSQPELKVSDFSLSYSGKIKAVYSPIITTIDVGVEEPQAHKALASTASYVKVAIGGSESLTDVTSYFANEDGNVALAWSPGAEEDGTATHVTCYTASLALASGSASSDVKYVLAGNPALLVNGNDVGGNAFVVESSASSEDDGSDSSDSGDGSDSAGKAESSDGDSSAAGSADDTGSVDDVDASGDTASSGTTSLLCVTFPSTGPCEYESMGAIADVALSYGQACSYQDNQDAGNEETWGLPDQVQVNLKCGQSTMLDVKWDTPTGFDSTRVEAQELTVSGKVTYPDWLDNDGAPETVTTTIKVAAPADMSSAEVTMSGNSVTYDGTAQELPVSLVKMGDTELVEGTDFVVEYENNVCAGTATVKLTGMGNYCGTAITTFEITKAQLTVNTESATKAYDGTALTAGASLEGLQNGETATVTTTKSQTEVGQTTNDGYVISWDTALESNYEVSLGEVGILTVTKASSDGSGGDSGDGADDDSGDGSGDDAADGDADSSDAEDDDADDSDGESESASAKTADETPIAPFVAIAAVAAFTTFASRKRIFG